MPSRTIHRFDVKTMKNRDRARSSTFRLPSQPNDDGDRTKEERKTVSETTISTEISLANPLLSNIDNSFVGKTVGTQGLAALSPATICTDQLLYLFSFLSRATTGLVSRSYGSKKDEATKREAAAEAASAPLTVSLVTGFLLSIWYLFFTPVMLDWLNVTPSLRPSATSYVLWRGAIAWAALAQSVSLSIMLATRDAITPLKIIGMAAGVNVIGDYLLCVWPLRWGVSGAAAATSFATLFSSFFMIKALRKRSILPVIRMPTRKEIMGLTEFTGPLLAITVLRLIGFVTMQRTAMSLGVKETAAYQLCNNLVLFFLLFAEPLSQLSQTQLPALVDANDGAAVRANFKSVLILGILTALGIGSVAGLTVGFGSALFSLDLAVQALSKAAAPSVFITVATAIFAGRSMAEGLVILFLYPTSSRRYSLMTSIVEIHPSKPVTVDGAMLASRDFSFMLIQGVLTLSLLLYLLQSAWCSTITNVFRAFTVRLGSYAITSLIRIGLGCGNLGRALHSDLAKDLTVMNGSGDVSTPPMKADLMS